MASIIQYIPGLDLSDHFCLRFELTCYGNYTQYKKPRYNLCQVDLDKMQTMVEAYDWEDALNSLDIYQAWGVPVFASCYESILSGGFRGGSKGSMEPPFGFSDDRRLWKPGF